MARKADQVYGIIGFFEFMPCALTVTPAAGKSRLKREEERAGGTAKLPSIIPKSFLCSLWMDFTMSITNETLHFHTKPPWVVNIFLLDPRRSMGKPIIWDILLSPRTPPLDGWFTECITLPQPLSISEDLIRVCRYFTAATSRPAVFFPIS